MKIYKIYYIGFILILSGCSEKSEKELTEVAPLHGVHYKILRESRQIILTQENPWESKFLGYFNVIKEDSLWRMWYVSRGKEIYNDVGGAYCFAYSFDGEKWEKEIPNSISVKTPIYDNVFMSSKSNNSILEPFVFYDEVIKEYKLIGCEKYGNGWRTYLWKSINGIDWYDKKLLVAAYLDTQFSVIIKDNLYYIYCRDWKNGFRSVGRFIIDRNGDFVEPFRTILTSEHASFNHIYNNAASLVDNMVIVFPTMYDQVNDNIYISIGSELDNVMELTYNNITEDLFFGEDVKWGIVSPGLIPTGEKNIYWMYYLGDNYSHNERAKATNNISKYYRIKIALSY
jgi:hypothetical protein